MRNNWNFSTRGGATGAGATGGLSARAELPSTHWQQAASGTHPAGKRRRGMAVVLVLGMLAIAMGISYALIHSQTVSQQVQSNGNLRQQARHAARTALAAALRKMHESSWGGVGSTLAGQISSTESYSVTWQAGDAQLTAGHTEEADLPYRVTLQVTGYAVQPGASATTATHRLEAVVQLEPRKLGPQPAPYAQMLQYTLYQCDDETVSLELPCRIEGPVRLQDRLRLGESYPQPTSALERFLTDLNLLRVDGAGDWRPFSGPLYLPTNKTSSSTRSLLTDNLGLTLNNLAASSPSGWSHPGAIATYRLYAGGPQYTAEVLGSSLTGVTRQPDPRTNPAGVFVRNGDLDLNDDVTLRGTVIVTGQLRVLGTNVRVESAPIKPVLGSSQPVHLPALLVGDDIQIRDDANCTIQGVVATWDRFDIQQGSDETVLDLQGHIICYDFDVASRDEWLLSSLWWQILYNLFNNQLLGDTPIQRLPYWLRLLGYDPRPSLTIRQQSTALTRHWLSANDPLYVPGTSDPGMRWSLLRTVEVR